MSPALLRLSLRLQGPGLILASAITWPSPVTAAPAPPFTELLRQAQAVSPSLRADEADVAAAEGVAAQATVLPNPVLALEVEDFAGSGLYRDLQRAQTTLSASQVLELGGKRTLRTAAARAAVGAATARARLLKAQFAHDLALAYAAAEGASARLALRAESASAAVEDLRVALALVKAGREADLRAVQAQAAAAAADAEYEAGKADLDEALGRLSSIAGASEPFTAPGPSLIPAATAVESRAASSPELAPAVLVARAERDAAQRRLASERGRATPDLTVSVGARRLNGDDATSFVAGVSAPFPLWDRNRGGVAAAAAQLNAAEARLRAAELSLQADWASAVRKSSAARASERGALALENAATEAYRLSRLGYNAGKTPLVEVLSARRGLTEARQRTLDARVRRFEAAATLARLAGRSLGES